MRLLNAFRQRATVFHFSVNNFRRNGILSCVFEEIQSGLIVVSLANLEIRLVLGSIILYCAYNSVSGIVLVYRYGIARNIDYFVEISVGIVRIFVLLVLHDKLREHACLQKKFLGRLLNAGSIEQ